MTVNYKKARDFSRLNLFAATMPLTKGDNIENNKNKKIVNKKITDKDISDFLNAETKSESGRTKPKITSRSFDEVQHDTFHLIQHLHEMEIRLSEHFEINAYEARFQNSSKRLKAVFGMRSNLRNKISENLRYLIENGMNESEIEVQMPFIPKPQVQGLILNEP